MIKIESVSKTFKKHQVLADVNLTIQPGERIALVGFNGAGKTTLIRCLLGEYVHQGKVSIDGIEPRWDREKILSAVGFVPQLPPPLKMPVGQLVDFAASLCGSDRGEMEKIAKTLGLDLRSVAHQPFVKLSGGQKQKVLIAIALGRRTRMLIMDEPAANLDPEARRLFFALLSERVADTTMLISSHRLDEVASLVNRVIELDRGKVVLDDRVAEAGAISALFSCRLGLRKSEEAITKTLETWRFQNLNGGTEWEGVVAGPDRLRFLGMISRYVGAVTHIAMSEK